MTKAPLAKRSIVLDEGMPEILFGGYGNGKLLRVLSKVVNIR